MKAVKPWITCWIMVALVIAATAAPGFCQLKTGTAVPLFSLKDLNGKIYDLANMKNQPMVILYFFDAASRASQEGLVSLDDLAKKYKDADLVVWGVTRSPKSRVKQFVKRVKPGFPILLDTSKVSDIYQAKLVLPTICILGPDLKLMDFFQGGGKTTEIMLVKLAQRQLQRHRPDLAKAISEKVVRKDPKNVEAKTIKGYAELKTGNIKGAEKTFYDLSRSKGKGEILGKEGLSQVYARKGEAVKARQLAQEVEKKSGQRALVNVVKGDLFYSENKVKDAEKEYLKAISKKSASPYHRAIAYNQLGRIYATKGDWAKSRKMYKQAVALDPYYIEATSNQGFTFERQGKWTEALAYYKRALAINPNDLFASTLAAAARKMVILQQDKDRQKELARQVDEVVKRFKKNAPAAKPPAQDPWTTREAMVITLLEPVESGGLSVRDGFARVLAMNLSRQINSSGRVKAVDPLVLDKVLNKLGLKQKDLAKAETQLKLGRAFKARLIIKGRLFHLVDGTLLNFKLVDTKNGREAATVEREFASTATLRQDMRLLNREVLTTIMKKYPLKAYVVDVSGGQVLINLGKKQGVINGTRFDVVETKAPITYKGKTFAPEPTVVATLEVFRVEDEFSYAHILKDQRRPVYKDDRLIEAVAQLGEDETKLW